MSTKTYGIERKQVISRPTEMPHNALQAGEWQKENADWWNSHPMRYDWSSEIQFEEFSKGFYEEIDRRFFSNVTEFMPWGEVPFDNLIDFRSLSGMDVLEIGVGNGSHAQLLATHAKNYTGIDITDYAVTSTRKRMELLGVVANIIKADAEDMPFADNSFDFVWSWGVIHHTSDTEKALREIRRVLKPRGRAITMVYHRGLWNYYIVTGVLCGLLRGDLFRSKSIHKTVQRYTDGAIARYYSVNEWAELLKRQFAVVQVGVYGSKAEVIPIPGGRLKACLMRIMPNGFTRFLTNTCRMGSFLVSEFERPEG